MAAVNQKDSFSFVEDAVWWRVGGGFTLSLWPKVKSLVLKRSGSNVECFCAIAGVRLRHTCLNLLTCER